MLKLLDEHTEAKVTWVVLSAAGPRRAEAQASAERFLADVSSEIVIADFRDRYFPYQGEQIKDFVHKLAEQINDVNQPSVIFTHRREDMHQDHRLVAELTWNAFRNHFIVEYEIPKYEGDLGQPNLFVPLTKETCQRKVDLLHEQFVSQRDRPWFTTETFWSLLRLRGLECQSAYGYAEAFHCRKVVM